MRILCFILWTCLAFSLKAQDVVSWTADFDVQNQRVLISANIQEGWHLYSQHVDPMAGPIPTQFIFGENKDVVLKGEVKEMEPVRKYDPNFEADVLYFEHHTQFVQDVELKNNTQLTCTVTFMVCDDEKCLPPVDKTLRITLTQQSHDEK